MSFVYPPWLEDELRALRGEPKFRVLLTDDPPAPRRLFGFPVVELTDMDADAYALANSRTGQVITVRPPRRFEGGPVDPKVVFRA